MLETLRERLLSVQQDFTSGWVAPPEPWGRRCGRGPLVRAEQGGGGEQVTGCWAGEREGGRGGGERGGGAAAFPPPARARGRGCGAFRSLPAAGGPVSPRAGRAGAGKWGEGGSEGQGRQRRAGGRGRRGRDRCLHREGEDMPGIDGRAWMFYEAADLRVRINVIVLWQLKSFSFSWKTRVAVTWGKGAQDEWKHYALQSTRILSLCFLSSFF